MYSLKKHYFIVVQKDLILTECVPSVSFLPNVQRVELCLGGNSFEDNYVISSLAALNIITGQKPIITQQKRLDFKTQSPKRPVGGKVILRGAQMYFFLYRLLFHVLPKSRQFDGLKSPKHKSIYSFVLKDMFAFEELVPLFPFFENISSLQCQCFFKTVSKNQISMLGNCLYFCFFSDVSN